MARTEDDDKEQRKKVYLPFRIELSFINNSEYEPSTMKAEGLLLDTQINTFLNQTGPEDINFRVVYQESRIGSLIHIGYVLGDVVSGFSDSLDEITATLWLIDRLEAVVLDRYKSKVSRYEISTAKVIIGTSLPPPWLHPLGTEIDVRSNASAVISRQLAPEYVSSEDGNPPSNQKIIEASIRKRPWLVGILICAVLFTNIIEWLFPRNDPQAELILFHLERMENNRPHSLPANFYCQISNQPSSTEVLPDPTQALKNSNDTAPPFHEDFNTESSTFGWSRIIRILP